MTKKLENFKISPNFDIYEVTNSEDHPELVDNNRIILMNNPQHICNITKTVIYLAQPIRDVYGITFFKSGYRYDYLNEVVKGSENSQHPLGEAGDLYNKIVIKILQNTKDLESDVWKILNKCRIYSWHQFIFYPDMSIFHISLPKGFKDNQILRK